MIDSLNLKITQTVPYVIHVLQEKEQWSKSDIASSIQAIAAVISIGALAFTIFYQWKSHKEQMKITELQRKAMRAEYLPLIRLFEDELVYIDFQPDTHAKLCLEIQKNSIRELTYSITAVDDLFKDQNTPIDRSRIFNPGDKIILEFSYNGWLSAIEHENNYYMNVVFRFTDLIGTNYTQKVTMYTNKPLIDHGLKWSDFESHLN
ncbi:hypothetical protein [Pedobacter antarcticus]|uniref:hypothetical protein n=1 Tax=Pedobacter antarcticus TaxID=34086 RepID=UPI00292DFECC|nr:hypothetical protein [Pedobacter antarcticus]